MAFYDKFPYTNFQELNLDTLMKRTGDVERAAEAAEASATEASDSATEAAASASEAAASAQTSREQAVIAINAAQDAAAVGNGLRTTIQQVATNTAGIAANSARISQIASLPAGSTAGDAELQDIRISANGTVYASAGDAVRGQVRNLQSEISSIDDYVVSMSGNYLDAVIWIVGYYAAGPAEVAGYHYTKRHLPAGTYDTHGVRFISTADAIIQSYTDAGSHTATLAEGDYYITIEDTKAPFFLSVTQTAHGTTETPIAKNNITNIVNMISNSLQDAFARENVGLFGINAEDGFKIRTIPNTYITADGVGRGTNTNFECTDLIPTKPGDSWLYRGWHNAALPYIVAYSDANMANPQILATNENLPIPDMIHGWKTVTVPDGCYYICACRMTATASVNDPAYPCFIHLKNVWFFEPSMGNMQSYIYQHMICTGWIPGEKTLCLLPGTYPIDSWIDQSTAGLILLTGMRLCSLEGPANTIITCSIASNNLSTLAVLGNTEIIGLTIRGTNCRYAVHDDYDQPNMSRLYKDCIIIAENCSYGFAYGGGCRSGTRFKYENCRFIGTQESDGGFEMHSNTGFTAPAVINMHNCVCESRNGHEERAFEIRGLSDNSIENRINLNACMITKANLIKNTVFDWYITGSGNNLFTADAEEGCEMHLLDADRYS